MEPQQLPNNSLTYNNFFLRLLHFFKTHNIWLTSECRREAIFTILVFNLPPLPPKALLGTVIYPVFGINLQKSTLAPDTTEKS